jgi:YidC/Oxa1 family membrane protein insertase
MNDFFDTVLAPLEWVVAWLMVGFHQIFTAVGLSPKSGFTWALSIMGLVIVIRIVLIPLFVKQIHASRRMVLIQPEMQKIQKKYKGKTDPESRQAMTQETMGLYKRTGTNPFTSCLPILLQSPVFFALFRVLSSLPAIANGDKTIGPLNAELAESAQVSTIFGAPLSSTFMGASDASTKIVTVVLVVLMSATMFTSQYQLMMKNMPANALDNPFAKQQKMLLYAMPVIFAVTGVNFPIGVLLYWLTTNVWTMGQQFYTIRRMPAPGSPAEKALEARRLKSGKEHKKLSLPGLSHDSEPDEVQDSPPPETKPLPGQREQPKRKKRVKPAVQGAARPGTTPPGTKPPRAKPPGAKPPGTKPPRAKQPHAKPPGAKPPGTKRRDTSAEGSGGDVA